MKFIFALDTHIVGECVHCTHIIRIYLDYSPWGKKKRVDSRNIRAFSESTWPFTLSLLLYDIARASRLVDFANYTRPSILNDGRNVPLRLSGRSRASIIFFRCGPQVLFTRNILLYVYCCCLLNTQQHIDSPSTTKRHLPRTAFFPLSAMNEYCCYWLCVASQFASVCHYIIAFFACVLTKIYRVIDMREAVFFLFACFTNCLNTAQKLRVCLTVCLKNTDVFKRKSLKNTG